VANLANNHVLDYGPDALLDSISHAHAAGIAPVGVGSHRDAAIAPAVLEQAVCSRPGSPRRDAPS
jgi:poly-gamma-glutamate capsule biosynthesis protein CapA/YwtB (metallophosphatase superfamily)